MWEARCFTFTRYFRCAPQWLLVAQIVMFFNKTVKQLLIPSLGQVTQRIYCRLQLAVIVLVERCLGALQQLIQFIPAYVDALIGGFILLLPERFAKTLRRRIPVGIGE